MPSSSKYDIVYLIKTSRRPELRYSLRSLQNLQLRMGRVWMVGDLLPWLQNVEHIQTDQIPYEKQHNALIAFQAIAASPDISEDFILMNDDFFIMQPTDLPVMHAGDLRQWLKATAMSAYRVQQWIVLEALEKAGYRNIKQGEIHIPAKMTKTGLQETLKMREKLGLETAIGIRQIFHTMNHGSRGMRIVDPKDVEDYESLPLLSTSDGVFKHGEQGRYIRRSFPTPSEWEVIEE